MEFTDIKTATSRKNVWTINELLENNQNINYSFLLENFKVQNLYWQNENDIPIDKRNLKPLYSILQVGFYFRFGNKIAVFERPKMEKDTREKITDSFSVLKSFSPKSLDKKTFLINLSKKININPGLEITLINRGVATTDIIEKGKPFSPHYLFLIIEINIDDTKRIVEKKHLNPEKNDEKFSGWYYINEYENKNIKDTNITFKGSVDNLILSSLNNPDKNTEDISRGYAKYYPNIKVNNNSSHYEFETSEIEFDEVMESKYNEIIELKKTKKMKTISEILNDLNYFGFKLKHLKKLLGKS